MPQIADGEYAATAIDHVLITSEKGTPGICVKFALNTGTEIYWTGWLSDGAIDRTIKTLRESLEWQGKDLSELNGTDVLAGREAKIVIENEEYPAGSGKTHPKVRWVNHISGRSGGGLNPLAEAAAKKLAEKCRAAIDRVDATLAESKPPTDESDLNF